MRSAGDPMSAENPVDAARRPTRSGLSGLIDRRGATADLFRSLRVLIDRPVMRFLAWVAPSPDLVGLASERWPDASSWWSCPGLTVPRRRILGRQALCWGLPPSIHGTLNEDSRRGVTTGAISPQLGAKFGRDAAHARHCHGQLLAALARSRCSATRRPRAHRCTRPSADALVRQHRKAAQDHVPVCCTVSTVPRACRSSGFVLELRPTRPNPRCITGGR